MTQPQQYTGNAIINAELAAVQPPLCGWTWPAYYPGFTCERAQNHVGATVMTDCHIGPDPNNPGGQWVVVSAEGYPNLPQSVKA